MTNKIINWVLAGVFLFLWYWVGHLAYFSTEAGGITTEYLAATVLAVALMRS